MTPPSAAIDGALVPAPRRILAALTLFAFLPFAFAELFWDDFLVIRPDGPIASLSTLTIAFFGRCVLFSEEYVYPYYRPMIDSLFVLEYAVAGTHPFLYHLTNFLLHLANTLLLFGLLRRFLAERPAGEACAFLGTALFAFHPIQVESVLWPAARPAVLCTFFLLAGIRAALSSIEGKTAGGVWGGGAGALALFVASLLSKEISIAAPPCLALLLLAGPARRARVVVLLACSMVILTTYLVMNAAIGSSAGGLSTKGPLGLAEPVARMLGFYGYQYLMPLSLYPNYAPQVTQGALPLLGGIALLLGGAAIMIWALLKRTFFAASMFAAAVFLLGGAALPLLGGQVKAADRYVYQALIGLAFLGASAAARFPSWMTRVPPRVIVLGVPLLLAGLSLRQSAVWLNGDSVWSWTVEKDPTNLIGNYYLGMSHEQNGNLDAAIEAFKAAAFETPEETELFRFYGAMSYGRLNMFAGNFAEARRGLALAMEHPRVAPSATVWMAITALREGDKKRAREWVDRFQDTGRERGETYENLARLEHALGGDAAKVQAWIQRAAERGRTVDPASFTSEE